MTRIPVPVQIPFTPDILARSSVYFPLVGAVIGLLLAAAGAVVNACVPDMPGSVLLLAAWIALSGTLHLDGLMDTSDGVLSYRSRERMLEIMKDSRVGAMGVIAAAVLLLFKFSLLDTLLRQQQWREAVPFLMAAAMYSRLWVVYMIGCWPFARPSEGMASMFAGTKRRHAIAATIWLLLLFAVCGAASGWPQHSWLAAMLVSAVVTAVIGVAVTMWLHRKLGGLTGDTYGALIELLEAAVLFAGLLWIG